MKSYTSARSARMALPVWNVHIPFRWKTYSPRVCKVESSAVRCHSESFANCIAGYRSGLLNIVILNAVKNDNGKAWRARHRLRQHS
jgi:hypothetical protein